MDGKAYPVLDVREWVRNESVPRGVNHIVVLSPSLEVRQDISYASERPLFCEGHRLWVFGTLCPGNVVPGGNVLVFTRGARTFTTKEVDPLTLPSLRQSPRVQ